MKRYVAALVVLCFAAQLQAANVRFVGATTAASAHFPTIGTSTILNLTYTPGGLSAIVTAATLRIGGETFLLNAGTNELSIVDNGVGSNDDLLIQSSFDGSTPSGFGDVGALLSMNVNGTADLAGSVAATEANIASLLWNSTASGTLSLFTSPGVLSNVNFSGVAAPEPGSMALLGGLALVGGVQVVRRRRKNAAENTTAC